MMHLKTDDGCVTSMLLLCYSQQESEGKNWEGVFKLQFMPTGFGFVKDRS